MNDEPGAPTEGDEEAQAAGACTRGHALGPDEKFCGQCGLPRATSAPQVVSEAPATPSMAEVGPRSSRLSRRVLIVGLVTLILTAGITTGIVVSADSASSAPWTNQQLKSHLTLAVTAAASAIAIQRSGATCLTQG